MRESVRVGWRAASVDPPEACPPRARSRTSTTARRPLTQLLPEARDSRKTNEGVRHRARSGHAAPRDDSETMTVNHRPRSQRVELRGLEPLTPTLPVWCATSCATAPLSCPATLQAPGLGLPRL